VAVRVTDLNRSRDFYQKLLGLPVTSQDSGSCFLDVGPDFLTLFRGSSGELDHFCLSVEGYDVETAVKRLSENGQKPRRTANRVYFPDPDKLTVQLAAPGHSA
jgi:catechol 2,3-dioxygenase-like lactoylglutathione lyase family enzyme